MRISVREAGGHSARIWNLHTVRRTGRMDDAVLLRSHVLNADEGTVPAKGVSPSNVEHVPPPRFLKGGPNERGKV